MIDPVPPAARTELRRLADRWATLPVGQARSCLTLVRELAQRYADEAAGEHAPLPDLGPAVALDQLVVAVYDVAMARSQGGRHSEAPTALDDLPTALADLRRRLP